MSDYKGIYTVINSKDDFIKMSEYFKIGNITDIWSNNEIISRLTDGQYVLVHAQSIEGGDLSIERFVDSSEEDAVLWIDITNATKVTPDEFIEALNEPGLG